MAAVTATDLLPVLKEIYPNGVPKEVIYANSPTLALLPKDTEEAYGEHIKVPLLFADPQGTSATFSDAQTNTTAQKYKAFELDTIDYYGVYQITGRAIDKSKKDRGSFVRGLKTGMDGVMRSVKRRLSHNLFRNHGGALGRLAASSAISSAVATLATARDTRFFEPGMVLKASTADGTSGAVESGSVTVLSVQRAAGTVTATAGWAAGIATIADSMYLFKIGDFGLMMRGFDAWLPATAPTGGDSFFGVDRSTDATRLAGVIGDLSAMPIEEALPDALTRVSDEGGHPDLIVLNSTNWTALAKALGTKKEYGERSAYDAEISFKTIKVMGPAGECDVVMDPESQSDVMWVFQTDTWKVYSMGDLVRVLDDDGLPYLRQASADGVELRVVTRPQLGCVAPGWNGRFAI